MFDCVVFLQAAASRGPAFALLALVEAGRLHLLLSRDIVSELRDVLFRKEVQKKFPILSTDFVEAFLDHLQRIGTLVDPVPRGCQFAHDPDDERCRKYFSPMITTARTCTFTSSHRRPGSRGPKVIPLPRR